MSTSKNTSYLNLDYDLRIEPIVAGGFILTQSYYEPTDKDEDGKEVYYTYKKAFSTSSDLLAFLEEAFGFPTGRARTISNVHPLPT